jgi:hypothetical protein
MTTKHKLTFSYLISVLTICSCGNTNRGKSKTLNTITSQTADKQATELKSIGGTYSFGYDVDKGGSRGYVLVYPLTDNSALFYLYGARGAPSYNQGQLFGQIIIKDNIGTYDSKIDDNDFNCILKFKFTPGKLEIVTEDGHDDCGFGGNVIVDHTYKLIDKSIPEYFIGMSADSIVFHGMTVKKYKHIVYGE